MLVVTQARLKPSLDDGFVHEDRQKRGRGIDMKVVKSMDSEARNRIIYAKQHIQNVLENDEAHEMEIFLA